MSVSGADLDLLMFRLAEGERAAFTPVFRLLWPPVLRLCRRLLENESDAADAAQQALEKVLTRCSEYDRARPALPWALGIATWECRSLLRKRGRRRERPEEEAPPVAAEAEEDLSQRELMQAAVDALSELSPEDREALVATFWDEAASVTGATLRKRRQRALSRLREAFRRLYGLG